MRCSRLIRAALAGLTLAGTLGRSAVLIHEYALRGTLADNLNGSPLTSMGGQITALGYVFAENQGLVLTSSSLSPSSFSIELSFRFSDVSGYRKIADFHNRADDTGFYVLNSALNFYPVVTASTADILPNVDVHVVLARDGATNVVTGYVNGQLRFTFNDTGPLATLTATDRRLILFADDPATSYREASAGTLNYLRVFNGALSTGEVSALFAGGAPTVVPEPPTAVLLVLGGALSLGRWLRVRNKVRPVSPILRGTRRRATVPSSPWFAPPPFSS
jgi:hypothetical protein